MGKVELRPEVSITRADNGFIVSFIDYDEDGNEVYYHNVIAINEHDKFNSSYEFARSIEDLIWTILDGLGVYFRKHSQYRLLTSIIANYDEGAVAEDVGKLLYNLLFHIPVDGIRFCCSKHPEYDGSVDPVNDCFYCLAIREAYKAENI